MKHSVIVIVTFFIIGCPNAADEPLFRVTTKRDNDKVEITVEKDKAVVSIRSPSGISQAIIACDGKWPGTVMLRLHLHGLEQLKITNGTVTLEAAVSSQDGKQRLWTDGKEDFPLNMMSPYWMDIRMVGHDRKPTKNIPLKDGCFEMKLPHALFEGNPQTITLNWIDFYR